MNLRYRQPLATAMALLLLVQQSQAVNMPLPMRALPMPREALRPVPAAVPALPEAPKLEHKRKIIRIPLDQAIRKARGGLAAFGDWALRSFVWASSAVGEKIAEYREVRVEEAAPAIERVRWPKADLPAKPQAAPDHGLALARPSKAMGAPARTSGLDDPAILAALGPASTPQERPRLRLLANLIPIVDRETQAGGFQRLRLRMEPAHTNAYAAAVGIAPARTAAAGVPGRGARPASAPAVGQRMQLGDGRTMALKSFDASKPEGQRYAYVITNKNGSTQMLYASPLVFDLGGRGVRTKPRITFFDIDGDGRLDTIDDIGQGGGLLVFDADGDGKPGKDGRGVFGNNTNLSGGKAGGGYADGFEALWAFARKAAAEGILSRRVLKTGTLEARDLEALEKAYGLGMKMGGFNRPTMSLRDAGVLGIVLPHGKTRCSKDFDGRGNGVCRRSGASFVRADGTEGSYEDIWFIRKQATARSR